MGDVHQTTSKFEKLVSELRLKIEGKSNLIEEIHKSLLHKINENQSIIYSLRTSYGRISPKEIK